MKTIYLVRHAKASSRNLGIADFERALVKKGKKDARRVSKKLINGGIKPEILVSSPAKRAIETACVFAEVMGYPIKNIILEKDLYDANEQILLRIIKNMEDNYKSIMIFGHDPSISNLAMNLSKDFDEYMGKCGVVCITFSRNSWKRILRKQGRLIFTYYPENKAQRREYYKNVRQELESEISEQIEEIVKAKDINASDNDKKYLKGISAQLAKKFVKTLKESNKKIDRVTKEQRHKGQERTNEDKSSF